jgi:hypothetical protein
VKVTAQEIQAMELGAPRNKLRTKTGIDGFCLFMLLDMFDIVGDMLPDMMHVTKGTSDFPIYNALFVRKN